MWHQSYMNYNSLGDYSRTRESYYLDFNVLSTTQSSKDVHESSHISDDTWTIIVYSCICVKRTEVFSCLRFQTRFSIETPETAWRLAVQVSALFPAQGCKCCKKNYLKPKNYELKHIDDLPSVEFMYHVLTRMPRDSYRRRIRSPLLCSLLHVWRLSCAIVPFVD